MTEGIIIAIITGVCAVFGQWLITRKGRAEDAAERARLDERTALRLASIERKLDEHNGYAGKIGEMQQDIAVIKTELQVLKERN
ncbi:MAG: hypothetical protein IJG53_08460 [Eggerthellaceae bacterium]|nr:hypothetical protein [Eggerthellaceae bacterium]